MNLSRRSFLFQFGAAMAGLAATAETASATSDEVLLQQQLNSNNVLRLERRRYLLAAPLVVRSDGAVIMGAGRRNTVLQTTFAGPAIRGDGTPHQDFRLRQLSVLGTCPHLIHLNDLSGALIDDVLISNNMGIGIRVEGQKSATCNVFRDLLITNNSTGIYFGALSNSARVVQGHFQSCDLTFNIADDRSANNIVFESPVVESVRTGAKGWVIGGANCRISGARIELPDPSSIGLDIQFGGKSWSVDGCHWSVRGKPILNRWAIPGRNEDGVPEAGA